MLVESKTRPTIAILEDILNAVSKETAVSEDHIRNTHVRHFTVVDARRIFAHIAYYGLAGYSFSQQQIADYLNMSQSHVSSGLRIIADEISPYSQPGKRIRATVAALTA